MELTPAQRLILINQYEILKALDAVDEDQYNDATTILGYGFESEYNELRWVSEQTMPERDSREVLDILSMYDAIQVSYKKLDDTSGIDELLVRFPGFDGNSDGVYIAYARYFCAPHRLRFETLERPDDFNSHFPMLPVYRRMLSVWKPMESKFSLTREDIIAITAR